MILTGAGISAESGMETFRTAGGIWATVNPDDVATPEAFASNPRRVHAFYNARRRRLLAPDVRPNPAHEALARLRGRWPGTLTLVTQNIDDLHERAGFHDPIHMHGELLKARCVRTQRVTECREDLFEGDRCGCCGVAGTLRPHVVWFREIPFDLDRIHAALLRCDLFAAIGTSGSVYPAAGFVAIARRSGRAHTVELNLESTPLSDLFDESRQGEASRLVPAFVEGLLEKAALSG